MKVTFDQNITSEKQENHKNILKVAIGLSLAILITVIIFTVIYLINHSGEKGFSSKEELTAALLSATYEDDFESIMTMMPKQFRQKLEEKATVYYENAVNNGETASDPYSSNYKEYEENLDGVYGVSEDGEKGWAMSYEIIDYYQYSDEEKNEVKQIFNMAGIDRDYSIDEYGIVTVYVTIEPTFSPSSLEKRENNLYIPVFLHENKWYLGQYYGDYIDKKLNLSFLNIYTTLFGGFMIDGTIDQYGYKILDTENGLMVRWNPTYESYSYTDLFGNIHLCTENLKDTKVIGPDGGDPITEEEYNKQMEELYEEEERLHEKLHEESDTIDSEENLIEEEFSDEEIQNEEE